MQTILKQDNLDLNNLNLFQKFKFNFYKLAKGLFLPIAMLIFASIFLGFADILSNINSHSANTAHNVFLSISNVMFIFLPIFICVCTTTVFVSNKKHAAVMSLYSYFLFILIQYPFFQLNELNQISSIFWFVKDDLAISSLINFNLKIPHLNTFVFGAIIIGLIASTTLNLSLKINTKNQLGYFFNYFLSIIYLTVIIPIATILIMVLYSGVGYGLTELYKLVLSSAPHGVKGLTIGFFDKLLFIFGLDNITNNLQNNVHFSSILNAEQFIEALKVNGITDVNKINEINKVFGSYIYVGNAEIFKIIQQLSFNSLYDASLQKEIGLYDWLLKNMNIYISEFHYQHALNFASIGLIIPLLKGYKVNKKSYLTIFLISTMIINFVTGINTGLQIFLIFFNPLLYFAIYLPLSVFNYMALDLIHVFVGNQAYDGLTDFIVNGLLTFNKGNKFWVIIIFAIINNTVLFFGVNFLLNGFKINFKNNSYLNSNVDLNHLITTLGGYQNVNCIYKSKNNLVVMINDFIDDKQIEFKHDVVNQKIYFPIKKDIDQLLDKLNVKLANLVEDNKTKILTKQDLLMQEIESFNIDNINDNEPFEVYAPMDGFVYYLNDVKNKAFKNEVFGKGIAIKPKSELVYCPIKKGKYLKETNAKNSFLFCSDTNPNILMSIGIDEQNTKNLDIATLKEQYASQNLIIGKINNGKLMEKDFICPIVCLQKNRKIELCVKNRQVVKRGELIFKVI